MSGCRGDALREPAGEVYWLFRKAWREKGPAPRFGKAERAGQVWSGEALRSVTVEIEDRASWRWRSAFLAGRQTLNARKPMMAPNENPALQPGPRGEGKERTSQQSAQPGAARDR